MTKAEQRIRCFTSGMKKLGNDSRDYIHKLAHVLFLVEQPPVCPVTDGDFSERKKESKKVWMGKYPALKVITIEEVFYEKHS